jgi:archaeosine-15-forming tRNA-guanine transglycosylase
MQFSNPLGNLRDLRKRDDVCVCEEVDSVVAKYRVMLDMWTLK